ncbi:hypothetical protein BDZ89DRAFT_1109651 [Hymenopellis radicata]|nr:hypothetical protein BDZ89DRAFT_1109651 [Hymenopellis radicata]
MMSSTTGEGRFPEDIERAINEALLKDLDARDMRATMSLVAFRFHEWTKRIVFSTVIIRRRNNWMQRISELLVPNASSVRILALNLRSIEGTLSDYELSHIRRLVEAAEGVRHLAVPWSLWTRLSREFGSLQLESLYLIWDGTLPARAPSLKDLQHPALLTDLTIYAPPDPENLTPFRSIGVLFLQRTDHCPKLAYVTYAADRMPEPTVGSLCDDIPTLSGAMFVLVNMHPEYSDPEEYEMVKEDKERYPNFSTAYQKWKGGLASWSIRLHALRKVTLIWVNECFVVARFMMPLSVSSIISFGAGRISSTGSARGGYLLDVQEKRPPLVFTHADLAPRNIMINRGLGIIRLASSAYGVLSNEELGANIWVDESVEPHGQARNCSSAYWNVVNNALYVANEEDPGGVKLEEVSIMAPCFFDKADRAAGALQSDQLSWGRIDWVTGEYNVGPKSVSNYSSFSVLDSLVDYLSQSQCQSQYYFDTEDSTMKQVVVIAGHSAGGQMVQRYIGLRSSTLHDERLHFWVANPASFMWLTDTPPPMSMLLVGMLDNLPGDRSCQAQTQGRNRLDRGRHFAAMLEGMDGGIPANTTIDYIAGVAHDNVLMMQSAMGIDKLFRYNYNVSGPITLTDTSTSESAAATHSGSSSSSSSGFHSGSSSSSGSHSPNSAVNLHAPLAWLRAFSRLQA